MEILIMWMCLLYANGFMWACNLMNKKVEPIIQYHGFMFWIGSIIYLVVKAVLST